MALESIIEAVRNRKTQRLFIVVDDSLDMRYKVINPSGEVLILPDALFDEDPLTIPAEQFQAEFTPEQLKALEQFNAQVAAQARAPSPKPVVTNVADAPKRQVPTKRSKAPTGPVRRGLGAEWSAPRLTFYRHKIDPLHAKQSFKIRVEGTGEFEITKEDFLAQFNDVVMSVTYRSEGLFSYPSVPDKARRFIKA